MGCCYGTRVLDISKISMRHFRRSSDKLQEGSSKGRCLMTLLAVAGRKFDFDPATALPSSTIADLFARLCWGDVSDDAFLNVCVGTSRRQVRRRRAQGCTHQGASQRSLARCEFGGGMDAPPRGVSTVANSSQEQLLCYCGKNKTRRQQWLMRVSTSR